MIQNGHHTFDCYCAITIFPQGQELTNFIYGQTIMVKLFTLYQNAKKGIYEHTLGITIFKRPKGLHSHLTISRNNIQM